MFFIQIDDETVITSTSLVCIETDVIPRDARKPNTVRFVWSAGNEKKTKSITTPFAKVVLRLILKKLAHAEAISLRPPNRNRSPLYGVSGKSFEDSLRVNIPEIVQSVEGKAEERQSSRFPWG